MSPTGNYVGFPKERSVNGVIDFISLYYCPNFWLEAPNFTARFSGVFDYVEAPGDESWNCMNMP
jgi:hypothetical protein